MALAVSLGVLLAVALFALIAAALGHRLLRLSALELGSSFEHFLLSAAVGVICIEIALFFAQMTGHIRGGVIAVLAMALLFGSPDILPVWRRLRGLLQEVLSGTRTELGLAAVAGMVLFAEALAAMAPVTGSDALHYHFAAPLLVLRSGFHPNFFLSHSFFCGQSHLLILLGLALGSSQFAMGLIFLGGALSAAACACLVRRWASARWAWTAALIFLLTPVVFLQISTAGAPDLWMPFFATMGVLLISLANELPRPAVALVAGALAGAVAGTKYTGCFVAASLAAAFFWEVRALVPWLTFLGASLAAGIWPYARNFAWTGDPLFPFMTRWLSPANVNSFALASYRADTGAGTEPSAWRLLKFLFFAGIDREHLGFWQFLGPLVLAFAPLLFSAVRKDITWRTALIVWGLSAVGIGWSSAMMRFLLPVLPVALAATLAGAAKLLPSGQRMVHSICVLSIAAFLVFGAAGFLYYDRPALETAVGIIPREQYLLERAPEYQKVQFINEVLEKKEPAGNALVFVRHVFYLDVPFVYGDPAASWGIDPLKLQTADEWRAFIHQQKICWVVRSPEYPAAIEHPLAQLEQSGELKPVAQSVVSDFQGMRILGQREATPVVILQVVDDAPTKTTPSSMLLPRAMRSALSTGFRDYSLLTIHYSLFAVGFTTRS
jgi:hypothetical protein